MSIQLAGGGAVITWLEERPNLTIMAKVSTIRAFFAR